MIRNADIGDITRLLEMSEKFARQNYSQDGFDPGDMKETLENLLNSEDGILLISEAGMMAAVMVRAYYNRARKTVQQVFWWDEGHEGRALLSALEAVAREAGAAAVHVSAPTPNRGQAVGRIYQSAGYHPAEHYWIKEL